MIYRTFFVLLGVASCLSVNVRRPAPSPRQLLLSTHSPRTSTRAPTAADTEDDHRPTGTPRFEPVGWKQGSEDVSVVPSSSESREAPHGEPDTGAPGAGAATVPAHQYRLTHKYNQSDEFFKQQSKAEPLQETATTKGLFSTKCTEGLFEHSSQSSEPMTLNQTTLESTTENESTLPLTEGFSQSNWSEDVTKVMTVLPDAATTPTTPEPTTKGPYEPPAQAPPPDHYLDDS